MRLRDIYEFIVKQGMVADLRSKKEVKEKLNLNRKKFKKLKGIDKRCFDKDSLANPYADTRILCGDHNTEVKRVLVGIDMESAEVILADRLGARNKKIDLILSHHPEGRALAALDDVMGLQANILAHFGLEQKVAQDFMKERMDEVARRLHAGNHDRAVDVARLLDIPFMCCHTASDNHVARYLQNLMDRRKPKTLKAVIDLLMKEPEYRQAALINAGPKILMGKPADLAGKVMVDMTGGTEGSKEIFGRLSQAGVKTILCMHLSEEHFKRIKAEHVNVIIAGHIASDNLGLNLLFDKLQKIDYFEFVECSGFRRVKRS